MLGKKSKTRKFLGFVLFWLTLYPLAIFTGLVFQFLVLLRMIHVYGKKNFPTWDKSTILASNHPSLWEPIILYGLFFPELIFHPIKCIAWSMPDKGNYWDLWFLAPLRLRFIPVPRGNGRGEIKI